MEQINAAIFYIMSAAVIFTSIAVIFTKQIMNAVFYAMICFFSFGFLFLSLNAAFNAAVQMLIYGTALSILFTIAVMITNYKKEKYQKIKISPRVFLCLSGVLMIAFSIIAILKETLNYEPALMMYMNSSEILISPDNLKQLSSQLLFDSLYSFELTGIYILIVLIGIAVLLKFKGDAK